MALIEVPKGLRGVAALETAIGDVRGGEGFYHYGEYDAIALARTRDLEEVWYLVYEGRLPDDRELAAFREQLGPLREVPPGVARALPTVARVAAGANPLHALRAAYALAVAELGFRPWIDVDEAALREQALRTCALVPTLVVALHRVGRGEDAVRPRPDLRHAANYLF